MTKTRNLADLGGGFIQAGTGVSDLGLKLDTDANTGIYSPGAGKLSIVAAGNESIRVGDAIYFNCTGYLDPGGAAIPNVEGGTVIQSNGNTKSRATASNSTLHQFFSSSSTDYNVGSITVTASATAYNTSSDYRLKENLAPISTGVSRLKQLQPMRFNFKNTPGFTVDGFLAHEVQAVVPEAVTGYKDAVDSNGNPVYQGIDQSKLVPLLVAALKEAITRIETLEAQVAAL